VEVQSESSEEKVTKKEAVETEDVEVNKFE
jgi:hypothetical protein